MKELFFFVDKRKDDSALKLEDLNCAIVWNEWLFEKISKYIEFLKEKNLLN
jgi:hypothetical protein